METEKKEKNNKKWHIWLGLVLTLVLHQILWIFPAAFLVIGLVQLIYILPAIMISMAKGKEYLSQGLMIGAGITFLVNVACYGYFVVAFS